MCIGVELVPESPNPNILVFAAFALYRAFDVFYAVG